MKQQFLAETIDTFRTYIYESNLKVVPESAFIKIFMPGGALLVARTAMTIGIDGLLSFELSAPDNSVPGLDYKAEVEYSLASKTHYAVLFYDVVRSRLAKVITDDDIFSELPQLRDRGWSVSGTAEGGSETTIIDSRLKRYGDGYFTGGVASCPSKTADKGIWWDLWKEYEGKAVRAYSGLRLKYDYSGDGSITGAGSELAFGSLKAGR